MQGLALLLVWHSTAPCLFHFLLQTSCRRGASRCLCLSTPRAGRRWVPGGCMLGACWESGGRACPSHVCALYELAVGGCALGQVLAMWSGLEQARRPVQAGKQSCMHSSPARPPHALPSVGRHLAAAAFPARAAPASGETRRWLCFLPRLSPRSLPTAARGDAALPHSAASCSTALRGMLLGCGQGTQAAARRAAACISGPNQLGCCATSHCTGCGASPPEAGRCTAAVCPSGGSHSHPSSRRRRLRCVNA